VCRVPRLLCQRRTLAESVLQQQQQQQH
jgi:hypothetical protein